MAPVRALILAITFMTASVTCLAGDVQTAKAPNATASKDKPDPQHARLASMAGRWTVKQSLWMKPGEQPHVDHGTATLGMVLNGRHLRQDLHIDSPDKPFDGLGYIGYDNATSEYFSTWMDVNFPGLVLAKGGFDTATNTYTFKGSMADASRAGAHIPLREVLHVIDNNHFTYEYYEDHGAGEALAVRLEYTRES
jgi:hypothetical protein